MPREWNLVSMKCTFVHMLRFIVSTWAAIQVFTFSPVLANTSNSATASADIVKPLHQARGELNEEADQRFKSLFSNWTLLERANPTLETSAEASAYSSPLPQRSVSVPSRIPLEGAALTSGFGMRTHPVLRVRRAHAGIDLAATTGTPIYATANGVIGRADWFSSYGLYISINHGGSIETRYAHLSRLAVRAGDYVQRGDLIGYVGSTGRSTGPHLHYEVRVAGLAVNPIPYMTQNEAQLAYVSNARLTGQGGE